MGVYQYKQENSHRDHRDEDILGFQKKPPDENIPEGVLKRFKKMD